MAYDLEERTINFSKEVIEFCRNIKLTSINRPLVDQLVRSATSVGANYREANGASSKKDFKNKIHLCKKEAKEANYWLELFEKSLPGRDQLLKESHELLLIFSKIAASSK